MNLKEVNEVCKSLERDGLIMKIDGKWFLTPEGLADCKRRGYPLGERTKRALNLGKNERR